MKEKKEEINVVGRGFLKKESLVSDWKVKFNLKRMEYYIL